MPQYCVHESSRGRKAAPAADVESRAVGLGSAGERLDDGEEQWSWHLR